MVCRIVRQSRAAKKKHSHKRLQRMRHKKLLTLKILNELMYDFDKKSKQNIQAIYYIVSTASRDSPRDFSEA